MASRNTEFSFISLNGVKSRHSRHKSTLDHQVDINSNTCISISFLYPINEIVEVSVRGFSCSYTVRHFFLQIQGIFFDYIVAEQLLHVALDFSLCDNTPILIFVQTQIGFPDLTYVTCIKKLIRKVWPGLEFSVAQQLVHFICDLFPSDNTIFIFLKTQSVHPNVTN
ncbi:hypothetical protein Ccrd_005301, partial [Cynara cardunculus var. scolymus]